LLGRIVGLVQARDRPPAPVEERDVRRSQAAAQSPMPQRSGSVTTKPPSGQFALAAAPGASPKPAPIPPTLRSGEATDAPPSGAVFLGGAESPRASAPAAVPVPRAIEPPMPARSAPDASFGVSAAGVPSPPTRGVPPQAADASAAIERTVRPSVEPDPLTVQAKQMLAEAVPRIAAQAQHDVTPVLRAAGLPPHPMQAETIAEVAHAKWISEQEWISASDPSPSYARILHSDARQALASGRGAAQAANIELRAFGANPHDPEIAAYLAYLYLRADPVQAETARQLALHAIVVSGSRRSTRASDWGVLAVASALTGRENDATRALLVEVALSNDLDATCRAALSAYSRFGERLRTPVQAMLYRVHSLGGAYAYPSCASPSFWASAARRQIAN
jgi:hypothetical protein